MKNKIAIVSPYPPKNKDTTRFSALGGYTKRLLETLPLEIRKRVTVFAQKGAGSRAEPVDIKAIWKRNSIFFSFNVFKEMTDDYRIIHIQHELYTYGRIITNIFVFLIMLSAKFKNLKVVVTEHGIISNNTIKKRYEKLLPLSFFLHATLKIYYKILELLSNKIIVHNRNLKNWLLTDYGIKEEKVTIIPPPLFKFTKHQKKSALIERLSKKHKIVLFFGYLAQYKGLKILISCAKYLSLKENNIAILIAGSRPERKAKDKKYNQWLNKLKTKSKKISKNIFWDQRFIPSPELSNLFSKSDVVVIPRPYGISSCGPFLYAVESETPAFLSSAYHNAVSDHLIYGTDAKDLANTLKRFLNDKQFQKKVKEDILKEKEKHKDTKIGNQLSSLYNNLI